MDPVGERKASADSREREKRKFLPKRSVANRYGVTTRTIDRWRTGDSLEFPAPVFAVNDRGFWAEADLLAWEISCIRARTNQASAA